MFSIKPYKNTPIQYNGIFNEYSDILVNRSLISAQNIASGMEAVLMSTHNLCFWAEIRRNNVFPWKPELYYKKLGLRVSK